MTKMSADRFKPTTPQSSTSDEAIQRVSTAIHKATRRDGWWSTYRGQAALKHLQGWGAVIRERAATGDPTASPKPLGGSGVGARSHDALSSIVMSYAVVDKWILTIAPMQRRLLRFIYVNGTEDRAIAVAYVLANGSVSNPCLVEDPIPPAFLAYDHVLTLAEAHVQTCKLEDYPGHLPQRMWLGFWGIGWGEYLEVVHANAAMNLAKSLGL